MTSHCEHCFRQDRDNLVPEIRSPVMTRFRYACRWCGEAVYLGYTLDEEGNPVQEGPGVGHLYTSSEPEGLCDLCRRPG
jgi:hypothetical protein